MLTISFYSLWMSYVAHKHFSVAPSTETWLWSNTGGYIGPPAVATVRLLTRVACAWVNTAITLLPILKPNSLFFNRNLSLAKTWRVLWFHSSNVQSSTVLQTDLILHNISTEWQAILVLKYTELLNLTICTIIDLLLCLRRINCFFIIFAVRSRVATYWESLTKKKSTSVCWKYVCS